jgi:hypothetical protein
VSGPGCGERKGPGFNLGSNTSKLIPAFLSDYLKRSPGCIAEEKIFDHLFGELEAWYVLEGGRSGTVLQAQRLLTPNKPENRAKLFADILCRLYEDGYFECQPAEQLAPQPSNKPCLVRFPDYDGSLWVPRGDLNDILCGKDLRVPDNWRVGQALKPPACFTKSGISVVRLAGW